MSFNIFNIFKFFKRSKKQPTQPKKFTLVYSAEADALFGHNRAITLDGKEVCYTFMANESVYGPWKNFYGFNDAAVVGYTDGCHNTYFGTKHNKYEFRTVDR